MEPDTLSQVHNKYAPYWAIGLIILVLTGLSTNWIELGAFWKGYVLDMVGPTWVYILFRGLYTKKVNNWWTCFFTPHKTLILLLAACFGIEAMQYFQVYDSTFDIWDLLAYVSIIIPLFLLDSMIIRQAKKLSVKN
jgi:hypothetical protein